MLHLFMFNINGILKIRNLSYKKELILKGFNSDDDQQHQNANQQNYQQNQRVEKPHPILSNKFFCFLLFLFVVFISIVIGIVIFYFINNFFFIILSVFLIISCIDCVKQFKDSEAINCYWFLHEIKKDFYCYLFSFIIKHSFVLCQYFSTIKLLFVISGFFLIDFFAPYRKSFPSWFESRENAGDSFARVCLIRYSFVLVLIREFVPSISHICVTIILLLIVVYIIDPFVDFVIDSCIHKGTKVGRVTRMFLTFISFAWVGFLINIPDQQQENKVKEQKNKWFSWPKYVFIGLLGAGLVTFGLKKSKQLFVKKPKTKTFGFIPRIISAFLAFFKFDV